MSSTNVRRRVLITSALPYINGIKHLGNLVGSMLPADACARYLRLRGHDVLYICATDEHGTPAELAAARAGQTPREYCDLQHRLQLQTYDGFGISFDYFGRSSSAQNHELTQHMYEKLDEHSLIGERNVTQIYSVDEKRFLPDRYVEGTCPKCGYEGARGDQCENCTTLLDPTELIDARSAVTGSSALEKKQSRHLYFHLSKMAPALREWLDSRANWPKLVVSIAKKWLNEGLEDRGITRDLEWGVPVNRQGFEDKVFYVWFDAPIAYIAATKEWADRSPQDRDWKSWWWDEENVEYYQFMAKDNVPFHTVMFPATLLGTKEPWTMASFIKGFNWLNFYGGKFSTSAQRGVFLDSALEVLDADYWRYWLLANAPESSDTSFSFESLIDTVNADLNDKFGNFILRVSKLAAARFGDEIPAGGEYSEDEDRLADNLQQAVTEYDSFLEALEFRKAIATLRQIWTLGNQYIASTEPWKLAKTDPAAAACKLRMGFNLIDLYCVLAAPVIPHTVERLRAEMGLDAAPMTWPDSIAERLRRFRGGEKFSVPQAPFRKLTDSDLKSLSERFGSGS